MYDVDNKVFNEGNLQDIRKVTRAKKRKITLVIKKLKTLLPTDDKDQFQFQDSQEELVFYHMKTLKDQKILFDVFHKRVLQLSDPDPDKEKEEGLLGAEDTYYEEVNDTYAETIIFCERYFEELANSKAEASASGDDGGDVAKTLCCEAWSVGSP